MTTARHGPAKLARRVRARCSALRRAPALPSTPRDGRHAGRLPITSTSQSSSGTFSVEEVHHSLSNASAQAGASRILVAGMHRAGAEAPLFRSVLCTSLRRLVLPPSQRALLEEETLNALRAAPALDPALVSVRTVVVRPGGLVEASLCFHSGACPQRPKIEAVTREVLLGAAWATDCTVTAEVQRPRSFMGHKAPPSLRSVGALLGISSCKGGVGKSTVAASLAYALSELGGRVGLLDADVHGPSLPSLVALPPSSLPLTQRSDTKLLVPAIVSGVRLMSYARIAANIACGIDVTAIRPLRAGTVSSQRAPREVGSEPR